MVEPSASATAKTNDPAGVLPASADAGNGSDDGDGASPEEWRAAGRAMLVQYRRALLILEEYDRSGGSLESVLASLSDRS